MLILEKIWLGLFLEYIKVESYCRVCLLGFGSDLEDESGLGKSRWFYKML